MNQFIPYLNATNNASSDSTGALAEYQVKSEYYDKIKVDRTLGDYIVKGIREKEYKTFILTGHAGDGKTSILVQVLKNLQLLQANEGMKMEKEYDTLYYVKDMSEMPENQRSAVLQKALSAPARGKSSLIIGNTGPLLNGFLDMMKETALANGDNWDETIKLKKQSELLKQLDENTDVSMEVGAYKFHLINIARMDNVTFSIKILKKMLQDELWEPCAQCNSCKTCPIYYNRCYLSSNLERVGAFVENFYRFLYENDKRMTIRQMVGQLSFALTGNLTCEKIKRTNFKAPLFDFNFANLFFGYKGLNVDGNAKQIKGIELIQNLDLDCIALDVDYNLFVKYDYTSFPKEIAAELDRMQKAPGTSQLETQVRCAVRRFYLMYSNYENFSQIESVLNQVFGTYFSDYRKTLEKVQTKAMLRKIQNVVYQALYIKNVGVLPDSNQNELLLTLRRADDVFQNVMLILGSVNKSELKLEQVATRNAFSDSENQQILVLTIKNTHFKITLPLLTYFDNLIRGMISSVENPALTHGISALDALLLENFEDQRPETAEDCELRVVVNTTSGQKIKRFAFDGDRLSLD